MALSKSTSSKHTKVVKPRHHKKRTTVSHRQFQFRSFAERISALQIDPVRKRRDRQEEDELADDRTSYFSRSLSRWRENNLSKTFTAFAREVSLLADNLPLVLHNQDQIAKALIDAIASKDELALEPLTGLLADFAHDLDAQFERHFAPAVETVAGVAATSANANVVEWCFTCLAWLFKYLARLLVPDLRPVFDLMAPFLGRFSHKPHIIRFAAESLGFLIRKAAIAKGHPSALISLMQHILASCDDVHSEETTDLYQQGIMTLLTGAMKGVQHNLHSSGLKILAVLLEANRARPSSASKAILVGCLTSLIHHSTPDTFGPILDLVVQDIEQQDVSDLEHLDLSMELLFTLVSVRKGSRVVMWQRPLAIVKQAMKSKPDLMPDSLAFRIMSVLAVVISACPSVIDLEKLLSNLALSQPWPAHFVQLCDMVVRLDRSKFDTLLFTRFQAHLKQLPATSLLGDDLLQIIPVTLIASPGKLVKLPASAVAQLQSELADFASSSSSSMLTGAQLTRVHLIVGVLPHLRLADSERHHIEDLLSELTSSLNRSTTKPDPVTQQVIYGSALKLLLGSTGHALRRDDILSHFGRIVADITKSPLIWSNVSTLIDQMDDTTLLPAIREQLEPVLIHNLTLSQHDIRLTSLEILSRLYVKANQPTPVILETAILIETTPVSLANARSISMNIRRLGADYGSITADSCMSKAIPSLCLGLLHLRLAQAWADVTEVVAQMVEHNVAEENVLAVLQTWLEGDFTSSQSSTSSEALLDVDTPMSHVSSDFECPSMIKLTAISKQVFEQPRGGRKDALSALHDDADCGNGISLECRGQALRVLDRISSVAEKRSRLLVPVLLRWAGEPSDAIDDETAAVRWTRKDQKAMLAIFAKFRNPKVLYRTTDVYQALLNLCANGDVEIQRAALGAILAWKSPTTLRYQQHLLNILDDAHFREVLTVFLQGDDEDSLKADDAQDLMPVLFRLVYGRLVGGSKESQQARRKAAFVALARYNDDVLQIVIDVATHGLAARPENAEAGLSMSTRQQLGMLNMLGDMIGTMGSRLAAFGERLLDVVMLCTMSVSQQLQSQSVEQLIDTSLLRAVRQHGITCLVKLFSTLGGDGFAKQAYMIRSQLLQVSNEKFVAENGQGVSSILRLISAWSYDHCLAPMLWLDNADILTSVTQLLQAVPTKDEVKLFIMKDIFEPLLQDEHDPALPTETVLQIAASTTVLLGRKPEKHMLDACVKVVSMLASSISSASAAQPILQLCSTLLVQPGQSVSVRTKTQLLQTTIPLLQLDGVDFDHGLYNAMCGLFSRLKAIESRAVLAQAFFELSKTSSEALAAAKLCRELNAVDQYRLDEPDHAQQEKAFLQVYEQSENFTELQWKPLMHNCIFLVQDEDDMVNRSSAAKALKIMINSSSSNDMPMALVRNDLFYAIQRGMHHKSEFVRAEWMQLLGHMTTSFTSWQETKDIAPLADVAEDKVSVFTDILHIQQHRRLQALRQLGGTTTMNSLNISRIFLPLLEHFVFDQAPGDSGRALADQTIQTIGQLAHQMRWVHLKRTLSRYYTLLKAKDEHEKAILRLIGVVIDGLVDALHSMPIIPQEDVSEDQAQQTISSDTGRQMLPENRTNVISRDLLPPLLGFLHHKDESEVDRRVAVAVSVVKLLKLLPEDEFTIKLAPTLTDVAHILRSRDLEAREQSRRALSNILQLIGLQYLGFMLKEMRGALQRGYQLHVLSYSVHSLLVTVAQTVDVGELDECVPELSTIIMDDIFGTTGIEKDTEEYRSSMKEIKTSKSYDTMEIVARSVSLSRLGALLMPIQAMLCETLDNSMVKKIDILLQRVQQGLDQNPQANSREVLTLYHELLRNDRTHGKGLHSGSTALRSKYVKKSRTAQKHSTTTFEHKITAFGLASLRRTLRRHESLQTSQNLEAFIPLIEHNLVAGEEECRYEAAKVLSTILHLKSPALDAGSALYLKEAISMVKDSRSSTTDAARAGLELATAILREKRDAKIREVDVAVLLRHIKADLDQPDRQGQMFRYLRAVLGRKIVVTEVYEVMDELAKSMINNPDEGIRQNARAAYVQFLIDFPQTKDRWAKTMSFLVKNFGFEHASGRRSALEVVHLLLSKLSTSIVHDLSLGLYVGLVPILVNDQDDACTKMANLLIAQLVNILDGDGLAKIKSLSMKWLRKEAKGGINIAAMQCWSIILQSGKADLKDTTDLIVALTARFDTGLQAHNRGKDFAAALDLFLTICDHQPAQAFASSMLNIWISLGGLISKSTASVQQRVLRAYKLLFDDVAREVFSGGSLPKSGRIQSSNGLQLSASTLRQICLTHISCLRNMGDDLNEAAEDLVRNLLFLGRVFDATRFDWSAEKEDDPNEDEDAASDDEQQTIERSAISYLFSRLCYVARRENATVLARLTALQTAGALLTLASTDLANIMLLVRPLYVLTDTSIPQREGSEQQSLNEKAREVLELVEKKVGSDRYVSLLADARRSVVEKRDERRRKRKIEAVSQPEKWIKDKKKRHDIKKVKQKARTEVNRARRAIF